MSEQLERPPWRIAGFTWGARARMLAMLGVLLLAAPIDRARAGDTLIDLGTFPGGLYSIPGGINAAGQIVGGADTSNGSAFRVFLWDEVNGMQNLGTPGGNAYGNAINATGSVAGQSRLSQSGVGRFLDHAFLWTAAGGFQDLGTLPGGSISRAYGISGLGQIVGESNTLENQALVFRAFRWDGEGGMQSLGTLPGGGSSVAYGVNDVGQVVGQADDATGNTRAFLWTEGGGMQDLGTLPGGTFAIARAINGLGQVVGWSDVGGGQVHAFLWDLQSGMQDLGTLPGGSGGQAYGINASGQVVGGAFLADGSLHAVVWDPAGGIRDLGMLAGGSFSIASGIDGVGQVVGAADNATGYEHAVRWQLNRPPVANDLSVTTSEDTATAVTVTASDPDNDPLTWSLVTGPAHGTLSGSLPALTYTPAAAYSGSDSFTFRVNDGTVDSNVATVTITVTRVNHPPVADDLSITTPQDTPVAFTVTGSDPDNDPITFILVTGPAHGSLAGSLPNATYVPAPGFSGGDSFAFLVNDGTADSNTATVTITITPSPGPPGLMVGHGYLDAGGTRRHFTFSVQSGEAGGRPSGSLSYGVWVPGAHGDDPGGAGQAGAEVSRFVSTAITSAVFSDDPALTPGHQLAPATDTVVFSGTGTWNGTSGYSFEVKATDAGEPGAGRDGFAITITSPGGEVVSGVDGLLAGGNIQSLPVQQPMVAPHARH